MEPEERAHLVSLCDRIEREQDVEKFTALILELEVAIEIFLPAQNEEN
jgi:hypothetical protein